MESRFRVLFLIIAMISLSGCAATKNLFGIDDREAPPPTAEPPGQVIDPEVERRKVKEPKIDREDFEVGGFVGLMSIEGNFSMCSALSRLTVTARCFSWLRDVTPISSRQASAPTDALR